MGKQSLTSGRSPKPPRQSSATFRPLENIMRPSSRLRILIAFLFSLPVCALIACGNKQAQTQAAGSGRPPAPVVVASVEQHDIPVQLHAIGNVEAYQVVQIRSQVNGQIQKIYFKEGEDVRRGQMLFSLDKRPFQATLEQAQAQL